MSIEPWQTFDGLSDAEQERVYESIKQRRMVGYAGGQHVSADEIDALDALMRLVKQERDRRGYAGLLEDYLPGGPYHRE